MKNISEYETTLKEMVVERKGKFDTFLSPQLSITAQYWQLLDHIAEELKDSKLVTLEQGSMGQQKLAMNPLLAQYDKASRTLKLHFAALGLNYDAMPTKVNEAKKVTETTSPLESFLNTIDG